MRIRTILASLAVLVSTTTGCKNDNQASEKAPTAPKAVEAPLADPDPAALQPAPTEPEARPALPDQPGPDGVHIVPRAGHAAAGTATLAEEPPDEPAAAEPVDRLAPENHETGAERDEAPADPGAAPAR